MWALQCSSPVLAYPINVTKFQAAEAPPGPPRRRRRPTKTTDPTGATKRPGVSASSSTANSIKITPAQQVIEKLSVLFTFWRFCLTFM